jgi:DNA-binding NtrC family response regulator
MPSDQTLTFLIAARDQLNRAIEAYQTEGKQWDRKRRPLLLQKLLKKTLVPLKESSPIAEQERILIRHALETAGGNVSEAARLLRIGRDALRYKIKKHCL